MAETLTPLPMKIYSCKLRKAYLCTFKGNLPTGASDAFGSRFCDVPASPNRSDLECSELKVEETPIVAQVTKGGMLT